MLPAPIITKNPHESPINKFFKINMFFNRYVLLKSLIGYEYKMAIIPVIKKRMILVLESKKKLVEIKIVNAIATETPSLFLTSVRGLPI